MEKNPQEYNCEVCYFKSSRKNDFDKHLLTQKHLRYTNDIKTAIKPAKIHENIKITHNYNCSNCDLSFCKQRDYNKHILTKKHLKNKDGKKNDDCISCECGKKYKHYSGLWRHKKICSFENNEPIIINMNNENIIMNTNEDPSENEIKIMAKLVLELVKSNTELQKQMIEVCKNVQIPTPSTVNTINSHNKTFNLQFFLNEQCKNAMNLNDFVDSFNLNLDDLERICREGYAEGIAYIILEKLRATDIYKRPIHCSDAKRDTMYVKTDDVWSKEGSNYDKMTIAVKNIGQKNFMLLNEFRKLHPDCLNYDSEHNDHYSKLVMNAAGGCIKENILKIIRLIAKEVVIEK
jgi:hypothetical protein